MRTPRPKRPGRRVKRVVICAFCGKEFHPWNGQVNAKYCSRKCNCRSRHTHKFQVKAGRAGGLVIGNRTRGTGTKGYVKYFQQHEHRFVAEKLLGRKLKKGEVVHHKDENKHNNCPENLEIMSWSKHSSIHLKKMWRKRKLNNAI